MTECVICGETEKRLVKHHTDYQNDITVLLCDKCHVNLHRGNIECDIPVPLPNTKDDSILKNLKKGKLDYYDCIEKTVSLSALVNPTIQVPPKWAGHKMLMILIGDKPHDLECESELKDQNDLTTKLYGDKKERQFYFRLPKTAVRLMGLKHKDEFKLEIEGDKLILTRCKD